jgi:hypothetical protein
MGCLLVLADTPLLSFALPVFQPGFYVLRSLV